MSLFTASFFGIEKDAMQKLVLQGSERKKKKVYILKRRFCSIKFWEEYV